MTADILHKDYIASQVKWCKVRDTVAGEDAVKERGPDYLPKLDSHKDGTPESAQQYTNYIARACVHGAAGRTLMGVVGAILRRAPACEGVPDEAKKALDDAAGRDYEPLQQIVQDGLGELSSVGRWGLLVDKDRDPDSSPYLLPLLAEEVVFWAYGVINGRRVPVLIAIKQEYEKPKDGDVIGNLTERKPEWRMLRLGVIAELPDYLAGAPGAEGFSGAPSDEPVYWQEVWREAESKSASEATSGLVLHEVIVPTKNGGRFWNEIPCDIVNAVGGITLDVEVPPMLGLANLVLAHYRNSADLEWGRHMCAIPQPWVAGFDIEKGETLVVGCGHAWSTPNADGSANYLEFTGAGLGSIETGMKEKEAQMAVQGARMLETPKLAAEAVGTVKLRQAGERSVLANIAHNCATVITRAIQRYLAWLSPAFDSPEAMAKVVYTLDADIDSLPLDPNELVALTKALQDGTISWETFAHNLRRGELLPPGVSADEERKRIQAGAPGRSRTAELAILQAMQAGGTITRATFLAEVQKLGFLQGIDAAAELAAVEEEKQKAVENQVMAFAARGGNGPIGGDAETEDGKEADSKKGEKKAKPDASETVATP